MRYLQKLPRGAAGRVEKSQAPSLVFQEADLAVRVGARHPSPTTLKRALIDDDAQYERLRGFLQRTAPISSTRWSATRVAARCWRSTPSIRRSTRSWSAASICPPRLPDHRLRRGAHRHRRELRLVRGQGQAGPPEDTITNIKPGGRADRSSASCASAISAASSSSTSSTWPAPRTRRRAEDPSQRPRAGPHQDLHVRALQARPRVR